MRLQTINCSVVVGTPGVKLGLVVCLGIGGSSEELFPVGGIEGLAENVMHRLALPAQLTHRVYLLGEIGTIDRKDADGVAMAMSEDLLDENQLRAFSEGYSEKGKGDEC